MYITNILKRLFREAPLYVTNIPEAAGKPDLIWCGGLCAAPIPAKRPLDERGLCAVCGTHNWARIRPHEFTWTTQQHASPAAVSESNVVSLEERLRLRQQPIFIGPEKPERTGKEKRKKAA